MLLKYVTSQMTLKMQCSLPHSSVPHLALKSDTAIITSNFFLFNFF